MFKLKTSLFCIIALFIVNNVSAAPIEYPLVSTPDNGMSFNVDRANKVHQLAMYVITVEKKKGIILYNSKHRIGTDYQGVQVVIVYEGWRYTVWVANANEGNKFHLKDLISFWIRRDGTQEQKDLISFSDEGLDGNVEDPKHRSVYDFAVKELLHFYEN